MAALLEHDKPEVFDKPRKRLIDAFGGEHVVITVYGNYGTFDIRNCS